MEHEKLIHRKVTKEDTQECPVDRISPVVCAVMSPRDEEEEYATQRQNHPLIPGWDVEFVEKIELRHQPACWREEADVNGMQRARGNKLRQDMGDGENPDD